MTNTAARNYNTIEATEIVKNRIREHIREKEAVKSRLFYYLRSTQTAGRMTAESLTSR